MTAPRTEKGGGPRSWLARPVTRIVLALVGAFLLIQLVPLRVQNHAVASEPSWDSAQTRALAVAACFDCHSNQTRIIWYEKVAPISWWIKNHVDEGRSALNYSACGRGEHDEDDEAVETVREGSMPPSYYTWFGLHSDARLSASERQLLADGLTATAARGCQ
jgi:mono/diheme cytochrome c family protein